MNDTENILDSVATIVHELSYIDINVATMLLGMNIVNETKQQLKIPLRRANLSFNQWLVLIILYLKRADTPTKLANILNADAAAITRHVDILVLRRLIERKRQTSDRRVIHLRLTSKGIHIAEKMYASYGGVFKNFENRLTQDELVMWKKIERCIAIHMCETLK